MAEAAGITVLEAGKALLQQYPPLQGLGASLPLVDFCWVHAGSRLVLLSGYARVFVVADGSLVQEICPLGPAAAAAVEDALLGPVGHPHACAVAGDYRLPPWHTLPGAPPGSGDRPAVTPPRLLCVGAWPRGFAVGGEDGIVSVFAEDDVAARVGGGARAARAPAREGGTLEAPGANAAARDSGEAEAALTVLRGSGRARAAVAGRGVLEAVGVAFAPVRRMRLTAPLSRVPATVSCIATAPSGSDAAVAMGPPLWADFDGGAAVRDRRRLARLVAAAAVALRRGGSNRRSLLGLGPSQGGRSGASGPGSRDPLAIARALVLSGVVGGRGATRPGASGPAAVGADGGSSRSQRAGGRRATAADALAAAAAEGPTAAGEDAVSSAVLPFGSAADAIGGCGSRRRMLVDWWGPARRGAPARGRRMSMVAGDVGDEQSKAAADRVAALAQGKRPRQADSAGGGGRSSRGKADVDAMREAAEGRRLRGPAALGAIGVLSTSSSALAASSASVAAATAGSHVAGRGGEVRREIAARAEEAAARQRAETGATNADGATVLEAAAAALRWGRVGAPSPVTAEVQVAGCHARGVAAFDVAAAGSVAVTAGRRDGAVVVWDLALRRPVAMRCYGPGSDPVAVACQQSGTRFVVAVAGAAAGAEELALAAGGTIVPQGPLLNGLPAFCTRYGNGAAAGMLVVGTSRAAVVFSVGAARGGTSAPLALLTGHTGAVVGAEFARGGGAVVTAGEDGSVFLFSAADFGEPDTAGGPLTRRQLEAAVGGVTGGRSATEAMVVRPSAVVRTAEAPLLRGASHAASLVWVPSEEPVAVRRERAASRRDGHMAARAKGRRGSVVGVGPGGAGDAAAAARSDELQAGWWDTGGFLLAMRAIDAVQARRRARGRRDSMSAPPPLPWELAKEGAGVGSGGGRRAAGDGRTAARGPGPDGGPVAAPPRHAPRELLLWQGADVSASGLDPGLKSLVLATPLTAAHACRLPPSRKEAAALGLLDVRGGADLHDSRHLLRCGVVVWGASEDGAVGPLAVSRAVHAPAGDASAEDLAMRGPAGSGTAGAGPSRAAADAVEPPTHSRVLPPASALVRGAVWVRPHSGPVRAVRSAADGCCVVTAGAIDGSLAVLVIEGAAVAAAGSALQLPPLPPSAVRAAGPVQRGIAGGNGRGAESAASGRGPTSSSQSLARVSGRHGSGDDGGFDEDDDDGDTGLVGEAIREGLTPAVASTLWEARASGVASLLTGGVASLSAGSTSAIIASVMADTEGGGGDSGGGGEAEDQDDDAAGVRGAGAAGGLGGALSEAAVHFGTPATSVVSVSASRWGWERGRRRQLAGQLEDQRRAHTYALQDAVAAERTRLEGRVRELEESLELATRGREADREDFETRDERGKAEAKAAELRRVRSLMDLERRRAVVEDESRGAVEAARRDALEERERATREVSAQMAARKASETHIASRFEGAVVAARREREEAMGRVDEVRELLEAELSSQADRADQSVAEARRRAERAEADARKAAVEARVALKAKDASLATLEAAVAKAESAVELQRQRAEKAERRAAESQARREEAKESERRAKRAAQDVMQQLSDARTRADAVNETRKMALEELQAERDRVQPRERLVVRLKREVDGMGEEVAKTQEERRGTGMALAHATAAYRGQQAEAKRARRSAAATDSTLRRAARLVERLTTKALGRAEEGAGPKVWEEMGTRLYRLLVLGDDAAVTAADVMDDGSDEEAPRRARGVGPAAAARPGSARPASSRPGSRGGAGSAAALPALSKQQGRRGGKGKGADTSRRGPELRMASSSGSLTAAHAQRRAVGDGKRWAGEALVDRAAAADPEAGGGPPPTTMRTAEFERQRRALLSANKTLQRGQERAEAELARVKSKLRAENAAVIASLNEERRRAAPAEQKAAGPAASSVLRAGAASTSSRRPGSGTGRRPGSAASSRATTPPSTPSPTAAFRYRRGSGGEGQAMRALRRLAAGDFAGPPQDAKAPLPDPGTGHPGSSPGDGTSPGSSDPAVASVSPASRAEQRLAALAEASPMRTTRVGRRA